MSADEYVDESLLEIQRELIETLGQRMDQLYADLEQLVERWDEDLATELARTTHNLRGEAALFGLNRLVGPSRDLEALFKRAIETGELEEADRSAAVSQLQELREACLIYRPDRIPDLPATLGGGPALSPQDDRPLIYVMEDDPSALSVLVEQLDQYGFEVEGFGELADLEKALAERQPGVLVMDIMLREGRLAGVQYISKIRRRDDGLPVVFISARSDMEARLHACRGGGNAYFTKPLRYNLLAERLAALTGRQPARPYEILIVDDDLAQARYYSAALEEAGMSVSILEDPMEVLEHLERRRPDVIVLDLYMPGCSGPEIAAVLQQHESFLSIPVVFLSSEDGFEEQLEALGLGGEDFLTKPIEAKHLVAALRPRAQRSRALGTQIHRDGLTGLMTHNAQKARLELELARADRENYDVSLAMLDLDGFKTVNDNFGHAAGDRVLCALANMLTKRLRRTDMVARYGGDEFVVVLPHTGAGDAQQILEGVSESFSKLVHTAGQLRFSSTLSCGIASYPVWPDVLQLTSAADNALYEAKREGRNRVVVAD